VSEQVQADSVDESVSGFARLFAAHAAHLFEYAMALANSDAAAADATVAALAAREYLPEDPHLLRARLFAIARQEALATAQAGEHCPEFGAVGSPGTTGHAVLAVLDYLPARYREVLALVYRHGIWPEQLPAVLGVSVRAAYERLAAAEHEFVTIAAESADDRPLVRPALEDLAGLPLAAAPEPVWRHAVARLAAGTASLPARPAAAPAVAPAVAGQRARPRPRSGRRLQLATAAAVLPIAAIGCLAIADGGGSAGRAGDLGNAGPGLALTPVSSPSAATAHGARSAKPAPTPSGQGTASPRQGSTPTVPIIALLPSTPAGTVLPIASPAASAGTAAPAPTTSASAPSASSAQPSPSPSSDSPSPSASSASPSDSPSASPSASSASPSNSASPSPSPSSESPTPTPSATS
jgi:DNA-directed RNA polymerase specialized sigma24 family protein